MRGLVLLFALMVACGSSDHPCDAGAELDGAELDAAAPELDAHVEPDAAMLDAGIDASTDAGPTCTPSTAADCFPPCSWAAGVCCC